MNSSTEMISISKNIIILLFYGLNTYNSLMVLFSSGRNLLLVVSDRKVNSGTLATVRLLLEVGTRTPKIKKEKTRFTS